jgi:hypothetical protein
MPTLSYVHPLFSLEPGQASLQTLRGPARALPGPRCQSQAVEPWGKDPSRRGCQRSWCDGCQRTCNDLTHTLLPRRKHSLAYGSLATCLVCRSGASRRIARARGGQSRTRSRWGGRLRPAAVSSETARQWEGPVAADAL